MTWWGTPRPADDEEERRAPWRAGAELTDRSEEVRIALDVYDDQLTKEEKAGKPPPEEGARRAAARKAGIRVVNLALFALAVVGAAAGVAVGWMHIVSDPLGDAHAYYDAAARLNAGQPLYPPGIDPSSNRIYLYPPLFAVVLRPLALLPFELFSLAWELIVVTAFILLLRRLGTRKRSTWIAVGILGVPIAWALTIAQAHVPMTLLMAIGQPWSIAVAANIKLFPALIVFFWLGRQELESAVAFLVWTVLLVAAQLIIEPSGTMSFFGSVGFAQLGDVRNISPFTISPLVWYGLLFVGCAAIVVTARMRWGWALAVTVATLAPPRLLIYMLMSLLAAVRRPRTETEPIPQDELEELWDPAIVYVRSYR
jgi:glycosyl transferase family 87